MRVFLIICLLFPLWGNGQTYSGNTEIFREPAHFCTEWQSIVRPTVRKPVNAFYRFVFNDGEYRMELKISAGGVPFVVAKYARFELATENHGVITLYNENYERSCKGCGSRLDGADVPGISLIFPLDKESIIALRDDYVKHIRLYLADNVLGGIVTVNRSELLREEVNDFYCMVNHK